MERVKRLPSVVSLHQADSASLRLELNKDHHNEVPSASIGAKVMDTLHAIDPVAYVRYVSVYRQFDDVGQFIREIQSL